MNINTLVSKVKKEIAKDMGFTVGQLAEECGYRYRITKAAKELGDNVVEVSDSFFYTHSINLPGKINSFIVYAEEAGIKVEATPVSTISENWARWPKTSWATQLVEFKIVEES